MGCQSVRCSLYGPSERAGPYTASFAALVPLRREAERERAR